MDREYKRRVRRTRFGNKVNYRNKARQVIVSMITHDRRVILAVGNTTTAFFLAFRN